MIVTGSAKHGQSRRRKLRLEDGFEYFKGEWLEAGQDPHLSPTMFLIEQCPHSKLATHFHRQNEFQVVVEGAARSAPTTFKPSPCTTLAHTPATGRS